MPAATRLRAVAFGELDGSLWGAGVDASGGVGGGLFLGGLQEGIALPGETRWESGVDGGWSVVGEGVELTVTPAPEPASAPDEPAGAAPASAVPGRGRQQLCRIMGTVALHGATRSVDCVGTRCELDGIDPVAVGSARFVSAWFEQDEALAVLALRPRADAHHESELVQATLFDADGWVPVNDSRLSTTYDVAGAPTRTNLELWVGEGEDERPRRAAGEAAGPPVDARTSGASVRVRPLHCHSRGREGFGVYLLAAPQA